MRDFERALDDLDENGARESALWRDSATGRLSGLNRLFLEVRFLATFEKWKELDHLPSLYDLLRINRPALVSDTLAALAIHQLDTSAYESGSERREVFAASVGPRFGALVSTVDRIRSSKSGEYYVLWHLASGDDPAAIGDRLTGLAWGECPEVRALLSDASSYFTRVVAERSSLEMISEAVVEGRFDQAIELLSGSQPSVNLLFPLLQAVSQTLSVAGVKVLTRFRQGLGDAVVEDAIAKFHADWTASAVADITEGLNWAQRIRKLALGELRADALERMAEEGTLLDLVRDPQELDAMADAVQSTASAANASSVLEGVLRVLQRLHDVLPEREQSRLRALRLAAIRLWAFEDASGDQSLAGDVLDEVERILVSGCSVSEWQGLVDLLALGWSPLLTDVAFCLGVRGTGI